MTEYLSEDCITEILCRLPITAVVGFKCVCKSWNILISDVCIPRISRASSPLSGLGSPLGTLPIEMNTLWTMFRILMMIVITLLPMGLLSRILVCYHLQTLHMICSTTAMGWFYLFRNIMCASNQTVRWDSAKQCTKESVSFFTCLWPPGNLTFWTHLL